MALRLRRGTNAQRQLITPAEGELIYTTDTKRLYIGDGTTIGGNLVNYGIPVSINELTDVDLGDGPTTGQVLMWDGTNFVPDDVAVGGGSGVVEGSNYRINIVADDSTVLVDTATGILSGFRFEGNVVGDVRGDLVGSVFADDSTMIIDAGQGISYANVRNTEVVTEVIGGVDDSLGTGGDVRLRGGRGTGSAEELGGRLILGATNTRQIIIGSGNNPVDIFNAAITGSLNGDVQGSVFGDDSTVLVDSVNSRLRGNHIGSVYADETDLVLDAPNKAAYLDEINLSNNGFIFGPKVTIGTDEVVAYKSGTASALTPWVSLAAFSTNASTHAISVSRARGSVFAPAAVQNGDSVLTFAAAQYTGSAYQVSGALQAKTVIDGSDFKLKWELSVIDTGTSTENILVTFDENKADFSVAPKLPNYADDTARDAAITSPELGMMIFHVGNDAVQVYKSAGWTNI